MKALIEYGTDPKEAIKKYNLSLIWNRCNLDEKQGRDKKIQWLGTDFGNEKITGEELEQLFLDLEKDPMAQACWLSKEMNKVVIARIFDNGVE